MGSDSVGFVGTTGKTDQEAKNLFDNATKNIEHQVEEEHRIRNVFISFHYDDEAQVNLLRAQANREEFGLEFNDHSVKEKIDEKWRQEVRNKISRTSATIVMIGSGTAKRPNVLFEIEESYRQSKKVIGVRIYKNENHTIPEPMRRNGAHIVDWKLENIQRELDED